MIEYYTRTIPLDEINSSKFTRDLNELGEDGWDLVSIVNVTLTKKKLSALGSEKVTLIFKRYE